MYHTNSTCFCLLVYIVFEKKSCALREVFQCQIKSWCVYNIEAICELGNPTNTHSGELFRMLDIPILIMLIFPIFEIHNLKIQVS